MKYKHLCSLFMAFFILGCTSDDTYTDDAEIRFVVEHPSALVTRASSSHFDGGDKVGLYAVEAGKTLEISGNSVNNAMLSFDGSNWKPQRSLYWEDGSYDFYAYYPYQSSISSVDDMPFNVATDQSGVTKYDGKDGYEASDLLFASATGVSASDDAVRLQFRHIMSRLLIRLVKGEDYEGSLPDNAEVYIHNTITQSSIDLKSGIVTNSIKGTRTTIAARNEGNQMYAAIIVPQRIVNRVPLIEVVANGVSYLYDGTMIFKAGTQHLINLIIDRNPHQALISIGGEQVNW